MAKDLGLWLQVNLFDSCIWFWCVQSFEPSNSIYWNRYDLLISGLLKLMKGTYFPPHVSHFDITGSTAFSWIWSLMLVSCLVCFLPVHTKCFNFAAIYCGISCGLGNDKVVHPFWLNTFSCHDFRGWAWWTSPYRWSLSATHPLQYFQQISW